MADEVTVVVPVYGSGPHLEDVITALDRQLDDRCKIVVSHSGEGNPSDRFKDNARVTVLHSALRLFAGAARNRGLALADTEWVAFVDEDVVPAADWYQALRRSIATNDCDCIIGAIDYRVSGGYWGVSLWYVEFGSVHPYMPRRALTGGPSANMAVRRATFARGGGFPEDWRFSQDIVAHARMIDAGQRLMFDPTVIVYHFNRGGTRHVTRHMFDHGRYSARARREYFNLPGTAAVRWPVLSIAMLPARMVQVICRVMTSRTSPKARFLFHLPGIFFATAAWSFGFAQEAMFPTLRPSD